MYKTQITAADAFLVRMMVWPTMFLVQASIERIVHRLPELILFWAKTEAHEACRTVTVI